VPPTEHHVRIKPILEELSRRTLEAWTEAVEDCQEVGMMQVETFLNEPLPALLDAWADAMVQHQPDWINAQNAAGVLQYVATTLRLMHKAADAEQTREDAEYDKNRAARLSNLALWKIYTIRDYSIRQMVAGKNKVTLPALE